MVAILLDRSSPFRSLFFSPLSLWYVKDKIRSLGTGTHDDPTCASHIRSLPSLQSHMKPISSLPMELTLVHNSLHSNGSQIITPELLVAYLHFSHFWMILYLSLSYEQPWKPCNDEDVLRSMTFLLALLSATSLTVQFLIHFPCPSPLPKISKWPSNITLSYVLSLQFSFLPWTL
jgi:hypothetical protein